MTNLHAPRVYTASTLHYLAFWRRLRHDPDWNFVQWSASWVADPLVDKEIEGDPATADQYRDAWIANYEDVKASDFLLIYAKPTDRLRGALVEAGIALGLRIPVLAVGVPPDHTWLHLPGVRTFESLMAVRHHLYKFTISAAGRKGTQP